MVKKVQIYGYGMSDLSEDESFAKKCVIYFEISV